MEASPMTVPVAGVLPSGRTVQVAAKQRAATNSKTAKVNNTFLII
jgi:hypothetical protein